MASLRVKPDESARRMGARLVLLLVAAFACALGVTVAPLGTAAAVPASPVYSIKSPVHLQGMKVGLSLLDAMRAVAKLSEDMLATQQQLATTVEQLATTQQQLATAQQQLAVALPQLATARTELADARTRVTALETRLTDVEQVSGSSTLTAIVLQANMALALNGNSLLATTVVANAAAVTSLLQATPSYKNRLVNGDFAVDTIAYGYARVVPPTLTECVNGWQLVYQSAAGSTALNVHRQGVGGVQGSSGQSTFLQLAMSSGDTSPVAPTDHAMMLQRLPYGAVRDFAFGTSGAIPVTLSFWVYHHRSGLWGGSLRNGAGSRSYPFTYSVPSASLYTWAFVSITIPGDKCTSCGWVKSDWQLALTVRAGANHQCTAGAWTTANCLTATGTWNMGSNAATVTLMQITGIQLERGSHGTPFDFRPFNTELMPAGSLLALSGSTSGLKNRVHNGAFNVDQLRRGVATTLPASAPAVDRWRMQLAGTNMANLFSVQTQAVGTAALAIEPPPGIASYLAVSALKTVDTLAAGDVAFLYQSIERSQIQDFQWGTQDAAQVTLSFYVRAPMAGLYAGALRPKTGPARTFTFTYTVATANTWQRIVVSIAGDTFMTTPPQWPITGADPSGAGLDIIFTLQMGGTGEASSANLGIWAAHTKYGAYGTINLAHSSISNSVICFSGIQLERSPYATAFDVRSVAAETRFVQRYVSSVGFSAASSILAATALPSSTADYVLFNVPLPAGTELRATPTLSVRGACDVVAEVNAQTQAVVTAVGGWTWTLATTQLGGSGQVTLSGQKTAHGLADPAKMSLRCATANDGFVFSADY